MTNSPALAAVTIAAALAIAAYLVAGLRNAGRQSRREEQARSGTRAFTLYLDCGLDGIPDPALAGGFQRTDGTVWVAWHPPCTLDTEEWDSIHRLTDAFAIPVRIEWDDQARARYP